MAGNSKDLLDEIAHAPLANIIANVGEAVAEAQQAIDEASLAQTLEIYTEGGEEVLTFLRDSGYQPSFYVLQETDGEMRVSVSLTKATQTNLTDIGIEDDTQAGVTAEFSRQGLNISVNRLYATPLDARYVNRYGYQADMSSKLSFKIIPVPTPEGIDEIRVVPELSGKTLSESRSHVESSGFVLLIQNTAGETLTEPDESTIVIAQDPAANQPARVGDEITVIVT